MSDEINQQRQCQTCSVCFLTNDALSDHLEGYRSQERVLSANLEQCRAHLSQLNGEYDPTYDANDGDDDHADGDVHDSTFRRGNDKPTDQLCCPHEECDRSKPFAKRQRLIRHFAKHIRCKEVCVYCFEVFTLASQYIAHADTHRDVDTTKNSYTRQICDQLRKNVAERLDNCQLKGVDNKKRTRELAGTPDARRVKIKLDGVDDTITNLPPSHLPGFIGINSLPHDEASLQPVTASTPLFSVAEPMASGGTFVGIPAQSLHPNSVAASARVPIESLNESYGAPIFWALTYPSNNVAEQFGGQMGDIHTSIMDLSSDLRVGEYSTMPQGGQENYVFGHLHKGAEEYHGHS